MKKKLAMLLAATMLVTLFTGCGAGGKEDKGELNLYTWDGMFPQEILDGFEKETGIRINYSNFDYDEDMLAKLEETKGGDYDLVIADDYIIELAIQEGLVQKLDTSRISSYDNLNPVFMSQFYDPQNEYTVPYGAGIPLIVYDPGLTDVKITGYEDLWNPELENNVALTANYRVIDGITLKTMGESFNTEDLDVIRAAGDKLLTLAPNIRVINDNNTQDYLISGEVAAAFLYTSQVSTALQARPDLEVVYPKEGLGFGIMAGFVPAKAPNADAAYAFLDYINQPENAAKCFEYIGYYCTNKAAEEYISEDMKKMIVLPEDAAEVDGLPADVTVLRQPVENIYLVSTSVMDLLLHLDALDSVAFSGTKAEGWYLPEVKQAMEEGKIAYAGKYSAPDYEQILAAGCRLAIENTMILHTPEVKEQLEHFGIPVLVERSSYESDPLARMEWIKLYGILLGREEQAEQVFSAQETAVQPILSQEPTGKSCAFFSLTTNNLATVRKGSDYVARMIEMAGGSYVFADLTDNGNSLATMNLPLEDFYAGAKDADVLIYNSAIEGMIASVSQLTERFPLLNEFKAVQNGQVWCTTQSLFQQSMELADLIVDMNRVFTKGTPAASTLKFLTHVD